MTTEYRMLEPWEPVEKGDEYLLGGVWETSNNWRYLSINPKREQMLGTQYRRPVACSPNLPQWKHPDAPGCPVHVLWAESPSTVRTVAQVAAEAKPKASVDPGTGYRLVEVGEEILKGDDQLWGGRWMKVSGAIGDIYSSVNLPIRRKLPAPQPQYRPYANAAEAAAGLQGKLICHKNSEMWHIVTQIDWAGATVSEDRISFSGIQKYWKFTDGTPCGVLITNQGTK